MSKTRFYNSPNAPKPNQPPSIGAVGIVHCNGHFLLERRSDSDNWGFLGGAIDQNETAEQCLERELFEEAGIMCRTFYFLDFLSSPNRVASYADGNIRRIFTSLFDVPLDHFPALTMSEESTALEFFDKGSLAILDIVPTHETVVQRIVGEEYRLRP